MKKVLVYTLPALLLLPFIVFGADQGVGGTTFPNPFGEGITSLTDLLREITNNIIIPVGSVVVVIMIIYAGFLFVTAQGNENKISDAKRAFTYAVIGALILLGAWVIANVIKETICAIYGEGNAPEGLGCGSELNI